MCPELHTSVKPELKCSFRNQKQDTPFEVETEDFIDFKRIYNFECQTHSKQLQHIPLGGSNTGDSMEGCASFY